MLKTIRENRRVRPTHIMYKANLSHKLLKECLEVLLADNFIEEIKSNNATHYSITRKGENFIFEFNKLKKLTNNFSWPS